MRHDFSSDCVTIELLDSPVLVRDVKVLFQCTSVSNLPMILIMMRIIIKTIVIVIIMIMMIIIMMMMIMTIIIKMIII